MEPTDEGSIKSPWPFLTSSQSTSFGTCFVTMTNIWLTHALILNLVQLVLIALCYSQSSLRISSWYVPPLFLYGPANSYLLQQKYSMGIVFSYSFNSFLFSLHTLAWACILHLKLSGYACSLYLNNFSVDFNTTYTTAYPMYALQVQQCSDLSYHSRLL